MYFPKNKIKTGLYTNGGEFVYADNNSPFLGYYYSLYNGKYYEGKSPTKGNREIIFVSTLPEGENTGNKPDYVLDFENTKLAYIISSNQTQIVPVSFFPQPTEKDYEIGQFRRYFCKKINENIFLEINKADYEGLFTQNPKYVFTLYTPFYLYWYLTGDKNQNRVGVLVE